MPPALALQVQPPNMAGAYAVGQKHALDLKGAEQALKGGAQSLAQNDMAIVARIGASAAAASNGDPDKYRQFVGQFVDTVQQKYGMDISGFLPSDPQAALNMFRETEKPSEYERVRGRLPEEDQRRADAIRLGLEPGARAPERMSDYEQAFSRLTPDEQEKAARIKAGVTPAPRAPSDPSDFAAALDGLSPEQRRLALEIKAGVTPAPRAPSDPSDYDAAIAQLSPEERAAAARIKAGIEPAARAPSDPSDYDTLMSQLSPEERAAAARIKAGIKPAARAPSDPSDYDAAFAQLSPEEKALAARIKTGLAAPATRQTDDRRSKLGTLLDEYNALAPDDPARKIYEQEMAGKEGISLTTLPDGTSVMSIGGKPGDRMGRTATNRAETDIQQATELLGELNSVDALTKPEMLNRWEQLGMKLTATGEQWSADWLASAVTGMSPQEAKKKLVEYEEWRSGVEQAFNVYRVAVTGAAAAVKELEQLRESFINPNISFSQFAGRMDGLKKKAKRALRLRRKMLREGLDPWKTDVDVFERSFTVGGDDDPEKRFYELTDGNSMSAKEAMEIMKSEGYSVK